MNYMFYRQLHLIKIFLNGVFSLLVQLQAVFLVVHHLMVMQHSNQTGEQPCEDRSVVISFDDETRTLEIQFLLLQLHLIN